MVDKQATGEMNRPALQHLADLSSSATAAEIASKVNAILFELRKTGHMRGAF